MARNSRPVITSKCNPAELLTNDEQVIATHMGYAIAYLYALQHLYRVVHWKTQGASYYGDHLLFDRLYEGAGKDIDSFAERMVGHFGPGVLSARKVHANADMIVASAIEHARKTDVITALLEVESTLHDVLTLALRTNEQQDYALDDFLMGVISNRDEAVYLLRQREGGSGINEALANRGRKQRRKNRRK